MTAFNPMWTVTRQAFLSIPMNVLYVPCQLQKSYPDFQPEHQPQQESEDLKEMKYLFAWLLI